MVTGVTGWIGGALVPALVAGGAEVHALARDSERIPFATGVFASVKVHAADLADAVSVRRTLAEIRPDVVIHLAVARGDATVEQRERLWSVNVLGTVALLESAAQVGCTRFVHAGSSLEYGLLGSAFSESDAMRPVTAFGASKLAATVAVSQAGIAGRLDTVTLRLFSVYGPGEPPKRLVPTAIRAALLGDVLPLTATRPVRDFVFIDDVCDALLLAAGADALPVPGAVYNVGTGIETGNAQVVDAIERVTGRRVRRSVGAYAAHASDRSPWRADTTLAREELGWEAVTTLDVGLAAHVAAIGAELGLAP